MSYDNSYSGYISSWRFTKDKDESVWGWHDETEEEWEENQVTEEETNE